MKRPEYRSCPSDCPNAFDEWGCDNPAHNSDPGWLEASFDDLAVAVLLREEGALDRLGKTDAEAVADVRKRLDKPWVREGLERGRAKLRAKLALIDELLKQ